MKRKGRRPAWGKILVVVLVFAALAAAWRYTPLSELITAERITAWARAVREMKGAPIAVMLAYTPAAFLMFPRPLLTLFTVIAFGPWLGFAYGMMGILGAALATYYAGRVMKRETVKRIAGDQLDNASKALRRHGLLAMTAVRIVPAAHYTLGTFLGMLPGVLATSVFGHQITMALEDPSKINWWLVGAVVAAFVVMTWLVKRWFSRQDSAS